MAKHPFLSEEERAHILSDQGAALEAFRESDRLQPGNRDVLEGIARLSVELGVPEDEALSAAERFGNVVSDPKERARALYKAADLAKLQEEVVRLYPGYYMLEFRAGGGSRSPSAWTTPARSSASSRIS